MPSVGELKFRLIFTDTSRDQCLSHSETTVLCARGSLSAQSVGLLQSRGQNTGKGEKNQEILAQL